MSHSIGDWCNPTAANASGAPPGGFSTPVPYGAALERCVGGPASIFAQHTVHQACMTAKAHRLPFSIIDAIPYRCRGATLVGCVSVIRERSKGSEDRGVPESKPEVVRAETLWHAMWPDWPLIHVSRAPRLTDEAGLEETRHVTALRGIDFPRCASTRT